MFLIISLLLSISFSAHSKLLDKTVAIVNDKIVTLSEIKRTKKTLKNLKSISPMLYSETKSSTKDIAKKKIQGVLIRKKLEEIGYVITDEQVEQEIVQIEKGQRINRETLLQVISSSGITFEEFFEIKRMEIEFRIFVTNIIRPLVSITEQDIKNAYYKNNRNNKTLNFKYTLVDFSLAKKKFKKGMLKSFTKNLIQFQKNGVLSNNFKDVETNVIKDINEEDLSGKISKNIKSVDEGSFSKPVLLGGSYHVFFVKTKDLTESGNFAEAKQYIKAKLMNDAVLSYSQNWFDSESQKYFIKYHL